MVVKSRYRICILCKRREKRPGSLFCKRCGIKGVFIKIKALRDSKDYKQGWITVGMIQHPGRLPKRM